MGWVFGSWWQSSQEIGDRICLAEQWSVADLREDGVFGGLEEVEGVVQDWAHAAGMGLIGLVGRMGWRRLA